MFMLVLAKALEKIIFNLFLKRTMETPLEMYGPA